jgi:hypothetical protein
MDDDNPSFKMRPEDYLCTAGVLVGGIIAIAASWTPNQAIAAGLLDGGIKTGASFVSLWIASKIIRFFSDV